MQAAEAVEAAVAVETVEAVEAVGAVEAVEVGRGYSLRRISTLLLVTLSFQNLKR